MLSNRESTGFVLRRKDIDLIVYDFDGVMTDNTAIVNDVGSESVVVNRSDGLAIKAIRSVGIRQLIISTEQNKIVTVRAAKLNIPVLQGIDKKEEALLSYCNQNRLTLKKVAYVGNDLNDVGAMELVGYPMAPQDAYPEAKEKARFIIPVVGGKGVVRELLNHISFDEA